MRLLTRGCVIHLIRNCSTRKMSDLAQKRIVFKTTTTPSLFVPNVTNSASQLNGYNDDYRPLNFAESFSTLRGDSTGAIFEENEDASEDPRSEENFKELTNVIDDVIGMQARPAVPTLIIERKSRRIVDLYSDLSTSYKHSVLRHLTMHHGVQVDRVKQKARDILEKIGEGSNYVQQFEEMRSALSPPYTWLFTKIGHLDGGVKFLVDLRASSIEYSKIVDPNDSKLRMDLREMTSQLRTLLANWFSVGFLNIERVTWSSPCAMLQKVSDYEAVHPMRNWTDLKARVGPYRRCFVYTHKSMPGEPIVVLHVALTTAISNNISTLVKHHRKVKKSTSLDNEFSNSFSIGESNKAEDPDLCTTAIFYSITSTQTGLQGIELGTFLIKQAVQSLKDEFPTMTQFSTLSPIPGFRSWLLSSLNVSKKDKTKVFTEAELAELAEYLGSESDILDQLIDLIKTNQWIGDESLVKILEKPLMRLCAQYLYLEKRRKGALDSVANFHLRNGSTLWRLNWLADLSPRGLTNSCGMMVNYRYFLDSLEENSSKYLEHHDIEAGEQILQLVSLSQKAKI